MKIENNFSSLIDSNEFLSQLLENNVASDCGQVLLDELHKLFQLIDLEGKGFVEVSEVL